VVSADIPSFRHPEIYNPDLDKRGKSVTKLINEKKAFLNEKKTKNRIFEPEEDPSLMINKSRIEIPEDILESAESDVSIEERNYAGMS
jgi:hypothetical protein